MPLDVVRFTGKDAEAVQFRPIDGGRLGYVPKDAAEDLADITDYRYELYDPRRYGAVEGGNISASLQNAIDNMPATGGIIDLRWARDVTIGTAVTNTKPVRILVGHTEITGLASSMFNVQSKFVITGVDRESSVLISATGGKIFNGSGVVPYFRAAHLYLQGTGNGSQVLVTPAYTGANNWAEGKVIVEDNIVEGAGSTSGSGKWALEFGQSTYWIRAIGNRFRYCRGGIDNAWASDAIFEDNQFGSPVANAQLRTIGGSHVDIKNNSFHLNSAASTAADLEINCDNSSGQAGWTRVTDNTFGGEGDSTARYKVRNYYAGAAYAASWYVKFSGNKFLGAGGSTQKCFKLDNPIAKWVLTGNYFQEFGTIIDDTFTQISTGVGGSVFDASNVIYDVGTTNPTYPIKLFTNGGRGFSVIDVPQYLKQKSVGRKLTSHESPELRNRLGNSEAINSWTLNGCAVTAGQTDPVGTTRAFLITASGAGASESVATAASTTTADGSTQYLRIWAKAGTLSTLQIACPDSGVWPLLELDAVWREYRLEFTGLPVSAARTWAFYPGNAFAVTGGTVYLAFPNVDDWGGDYYPTSSGGPASDTTYGFRLDRGAILAGGMKIGDLGAKITRHLSATTTWNPASVAAGAQTTTTVTVTNAAVGDTVAVGFSNDLQGMQLTGYVSAASTVTVVLRNGTAGALDLASGTLRADVWQH